MSKFQIIIRKFWIRVEKPIWSFIVNSVFWLFRLNKIGQARLEMKALIKMLTINELMMEFLWEEDKIGDWVQWPITMIYSEIRGDCDDAAALAKWWFKEHGIKADIFNLYSDKEGHAVCVTRDRETMVTNERVVNLNPTCWEKEMLEYFGNKYQAII